MDFGHPPFATVQAVGGLWHGSYHKTFGFRNRAGVSVPALAAMNTTGLIDAREGVAKLVDFGMPAQATPETESALGIERWNKAILWGNARRYSVVPAASFTDMGWPYKAPDGTVFYMLGKNTGGNFEVCAGVLDCSITQPETVVASVALPGGNIMEFVNFAPDGTMATAHAYLSDDYSGPGYTNAWLDGIVDISVSGGSSESLPTVTLDAKGESELGGTIYKWGTVVNVPQLVATGSTPIYQPINDVYRWEIVSYTASLIDATTLSGDIGTRYKSTGSISTAISLVDYGANGERKEISWQREQSVMQEVPVLDSYLSGTIWRRQILQHTGWVYDGVTDGDIYDIQAECSQYSERKIRFSLLVNGVSVASGEESLNQIISGNIWRQSGTFSGEYGDYPNAFTNQTVVSSETIKTGFMSDIPPEITLIPYGSAPEYQDDGFWRPNSSALTLQYSVDGVRQIIAWAGANSARSYGYTNTLPLTDFGRWPCINPETGDFDQEVYQWF